MESDCGMSTSNAITCWVTSGHSERIRVTSLRAKTVTGSDVCCLHPQGAGGARSVDWVERAGPGRAVELGRGEYAISDFSLDSCSESSDKTMCCVSPCLVIKQRIKAPLERHLPREPAMASRGPSAGATSGVRDTHHAAAARRSARKRLNAPQQHLIQPIPIN